MNILFEINSNIFIVSNINNPSVFTYKRINILYTIVDDKLYVKGNYFRYKFNKKFSEAIRELNDVYLYILSKK